MAKAFPIGKAFFVGFWGVFGLKRRLISIAHNGDTFKRNNMHNFAPLIAYFSSKFLLLISNHFQSTAL
jgi:hypothetical protein